MKRAIVISSVFFSPSSSLQLARKDSPEQVPIHTGVENRSYVDQDWHSEYGNGHYPGWKEVFDDYHIPNAHSYEDKQSDGKPSLMQITEVPIHTGVENRSYVDQDWHSEYGNGHYPGWKEVFDDYHIPNAHSYEDKQSDGNPSLMQTAEVPIHTGVENRSYVDQDWHSEYGNGHYPGWKEVFDDYHIPNAHSYEDKQSDGKPSLMQTAEVPIHTGVENRSYVDQDWHSEYGNGHYPGWKEVFDDYHIPNAHSYEDKQSDGKPSLLQAAEVPIHTGVENRSYVDQDWHSEYGNGHYPGWKEVFDDYHIPNAHSYEDKQSDGKPSLMQTAEVPIHTGVENRSYVDQDWHSEYGNGHYPGWKEVFDDYHIPNAHSYEDKQSDGKPGH